MKEHNVTLNGEKLNNNNNKSWENIYIEKIGRQEVESFISNLEPTFDPVKINKILYNRYSIRGVSATQVDVVVQHDLNLEEAFFRVDWNEKTGRYDGKVRDRIVIRHCSENWKGELGTLKIEYPSARECVLINEYTTIIYRAFISELKNHDLSNIIGWHWRKYYTHLTDDDYVKEFCDTWEEMEKEKIWTLAEANRSASRALYRLSRDLGWRKLTKREKARLGLPAGSPQWQRADKIYSKNGCGEYTNRAAAGDQEYLETLYDDLGDEIQDKMSSEK